MSVFILTISNFEPSALDVFFFSEALADGSKRISKSASGTGSASEFSCSYTNYWGSPVYFQMRSLEHF